MQEGWQRKWLDQFDRAAGELMAAGMSRQELSARLEQILEQGGIKND